ncbi:MAG TPA: TlpA disulfide reductase family protein [Chthoniobacteraceae bacterium]|nr:TlpA disulfide reductase family protein [Chthoniobacteraceae bacterium]
MMTATRRRLLFLALVLGLLSGFATPGGAASADADWAAVTALDQGPTGIKAEASLDEIRAVSLEFLQKQEKTLRHFISQHGSDRRALEARLRLAQLLGNRAEITGNPLLFRDAEAVLDDASKIAPVSRRGDVAFSRIALSMRKISTPTDADRAALSEALRHFRRDHPNDPRVASLMTEIATLYDHLPSQKRTLLNAALPLARSPALAARIHDDLRRLDLLGQPLALSGTTLEGKPWDLAAHKGKVVVVTYFATWSLPSLGILQEMAALTSRFQKEEVVFVGISLDPDRDQLEGLLDPLKITWPVLWDGKAWESPLARSYGINALPTLWIIDRKGRLRSANPRGDTEATLQRFLKE